MQNERKAGRAARAAVVMILSVVIGLLASAGPAGADTDLAEVERQVVALHNQVRAQHGLGALTVHPLFTAESRGWSAVMAATGTLAHQTTTSGHGSYVDTTCKAAGLTWTWCGENVAAGQPTAADVHAAWMASAGHRAAILRPDATVVGVGAWRDANGRIWWTARFMAAPGVSPSAALNVGSTEDLTAYVDATYRVFTGRAATTAERSHWVGALQSGRPRADFIASLSTSDAWLGAEIGEIYELALGRLPDPTGREYWTQAVRSGTRITELGVFVFASDELFTTLRLDTARFVDAVHRRILGRPASATELVLGTTRLATGTSRSGVVAGVYATLESRLQRVDDLYRSILGRTADAGGRRYWADALLAHDDVRLAAFLAGSDEFFQRAIA